MNTRKASIEDLNLVTKKTLLLYDNHTFDDLAIENEQLLTDENQIIFLAFDTNNCIGFAHCSLRTEYVEGTNSGNVGYLEGIYVDPKFRKQGVAKILLYQCEEWAKSKGCIEMASDCELQNYTSYDFHLSVGFAEINKIICFAKKID